METKSKNRAMSAASRELVDLLALGLADLERGPQPSYARGPLCAVDVLTTVVQELELRRDQAVANARASGAPWQVIANATGYSRQGAWERWGA